MIRIYSCFIAILLFNKAVAQDNYEIQVYASPTQAKGSTTNRASDAAFYSTCKVVSLEGDSETPIKGLPDLAPIPPVGLCSVEHIGVRCR